MIFGYDTIYIRGYGESIRRPSTLLKQHFLKEMQTWSVTFYKLFLNKKWRTPYVFWLISREIKYQVR